MRNELKRAEIQTAHERILLGVAEEEDLRRLRAMDAEDEKGLVQELITLIVILGLAVGIVLMLSGVL
jgi:hypothetical protein